MGRQLASLFSKHFDNNFIFNFNDKRNRDGGFSAWILLRSKFLKKNIELNTNDVNHDCLLHFNLHLDVQPADNSLAPKYLIMLEAPQSYLLNGNIRNLTNYRKIFTWRDDLVDNQKFVKINFPNHIVRPNVDGFSNRKLLCCLIASNKSLATRDCLDLYSERVNTIKWFEKNAINDFKLYGLGWDMPAIGRGFMGKFFRFITKNFVFLKKINWFPSYCGPLERKSDALLTSKFSICYENVGGLSGYITEKIFDSFFYGCVPVYWGASNVEKYIPNDCFIDRCNFSSNEELYKFMKSMTEKEFEAMQNNIVNFLSSDAAKPFCDNFFAETIVETIVEDLANK